MFTSKPNQICKLLKSTYGLKQSSRQWFAHLSISLLSKGYLQLASHHSLFIKKSYSSFTTILIYVDDLIIAGNDLHELSQIKQFLHNCFKIKDLGYLNYFLCLEIARSKSGIHLCQRKYALEILSECGLLASKPLSPPTIKGTKLIKEGGQLLTNPESYRMLIGKLIYTSQSQDQTYFIQFNN